MQENAIVRESHSESTGSVMHIQERWPEERQNNVSRSSEGIGLNIPWLLILKKIPLIMRENRVSRSQKILQQTLQESSAMRSEEPDTNPCFTQIFLI